MMSAALLAALPVAVMGAERSFAPGRRPHRAHHQSGELLPLLMRLETPHRGTVLGERLLKDLPLVVGDGLPLLHVRLVCAFLQTPLP